jgi:hypothetical protein
MSTRPSSSWPWLDDALVELVDIGVFEDDPFSLADAAASASASGVAAWLGSAELADLADPALVGALDHGSVDGDLGLGSPTAASVDDPFHFEPSSPDPESGPDLIAEILLGAIDSAPGFVTDPMPANSVVDGPISSGATPGAAGDTPRDLDQVDAERFAPLIDLSADPTSGLGTDDPSGSTGDDATDDLAGDAGETGDLDDFDGVDDIDDIDDFDGL